MKAAEELEKAIESSTDILNPFVQKLDYTLYDRIKIAVLSVTLFPIRLVVVLVFILAAWLLAKIAITEKDFLQKPISGWRRHILKRMVHGGLHVALGAVGFLNVPVRGQLANQKEAPILVLAPHSSFFEILVILLLGGPSVLAKVETSRVPIYGDFITFSQPVYVQQNDKLSRKQTVSEIRNRAFSEGDWQQIAIFPEGTCTNRTALISFKPGAFFPGVPVQPVCLSYPNRLDTVTWTWRGYGGLKNFWLTLCQFRTFCEIDILPVYKPSKAEIHDARLFARNVQKVMAKHLKVRTSDWSFSDIKFIKSSGNSVPISIPVIKLVKLRNQLRREGENLKSTIQNFQARLQTCATTTSDLFAFAQLLEIETSDFFQEFFNSIDQDKEGTVDVRSYLCCLWLLRTDIPVWDKIEGAFKVLDERLVDSEDHEGEAALKLPEFILFTWILLTIPKVDSEKVFKELDKGTGAVLWGDFQACLENSPSALSIINADKGGKVLHSRLICDNDFFGDVSNEKSV